MLASVLIFAITYLLIASEKVDKTVAALLGATAVIMGRLVPYEVALQKVDLNVIFLLVGMMIVVNILGTTGVFEWIAIATAQKARGNSVVLMVLLLLVTAFVSAFLDNVTTVILIAPITILITQILEIPTIPFLILEAVFSNIGGTATLVGDPPNILIGSASHLYFKDFLIHLTPIILVITALSILVLIRFLRLGLHVSAAARQRLMMAQPRLAIVQPAQLKRALPVLGLILAGFFTSHALKVETGLIALAGAFLMVLVCRADLHQTLAKVEWNTILFFIGLFMLIGALEHNGLFQFLGTHIVEWTRGNLMLTAMAILWFSALASAIVDNIPLVIAMIPLIKSITPFFAAQMGLDAGTVEAHRLVAEPLYWSLALGACLGGNGSLIGASANVVISQIARRNNYHISFMGFTKYGLPLMVFSVLLSSLYIYLRYFAG